MRGTRRSRTQLSATPGLCGVNPHDSVALSTPPLEVNNLIVPQVVGGASNRTTPANKKKDSKKEGDFYLFIF